MKQLTQNVYTEDRFSVPPAYRGSNPSFVTTGDGVVMIDAPQMPSDAVAWRAEIERIGGSVRYLINTDHHGDHTMGNFFFPATVVAHEKARALFMAPPGQESVLPGQRRFEQVRAKVEVIDPDGLELIEHGYVPRKPTVAFAGKLALYVGQQTFELMEMPGHTAGTIGIYVPGERAFFAGDNFTYQSQASMAHCMPLEWVDSLRQMEQLDIDYIVSGHGQVAGKGAIRPFREFVEQCIELVRDAMGKGMSPDEAADALSFEDLHPGYETVGAVHPGAWHQRRNVKRFYEMLAG